MKLKQYTKHNKPVPFNWPAVIVLLIMTGIPAIPGLFILLSVLAGADGARESALVINPLYFKQPWVIYLHAGSGLLFFLTVPFQFSSKLRKNQPMLHKRTGYVAVSSGVVLGLSGILMHYYLNQGVLDMRFVSMSIQGLCMIAAFITAIQYILSRNVPSHRKWMSRAVAIALSLVTLVFIELVFLLALGEHAQTNKTLIHWLHTYGNLLGMVINLLVVEFLFKKKLRFSLVRIEGRYFMGNLGMK